MTLTREQRIERAVQEVLALCKGNRPGGHTFRMSVPADPDRDSDLILLDGLDAASDLLEAAQNVSDRRTLMDDGFWVSQKEMRALDAALSPSQEVPA